MHHLDEVPVFRHHADRSLPCCLEDLFVLNLVETQVAERHCFDTVLGAEPAGQGRGKMGVEPESHAARTG